MKIKHIKIQNFHCYKNADFDFANQTTVFIGKNGTGKSSLIKAICNALSFIFNKSNNSWGYKSLANEVSDLGVQNINIREIYHEQNIADFVSIEGNVIMDAFNTCLSDEDLTLQWDFRKKSFEKSTLLSTLYKDAYIRFRKHIERTDILPILVYYSDRYPHINTKLGINAKTLLNEDYDISRTWGYYHWNEFTSCTEIWQNRFIRISNQIISIERSLNEIKDPLVCKTLLLQREKIYNEIKYVTEFLKVFTDNTIKGLSDTSDDMKISTISVDGVTNFYIKIMFADGVQRRWYELPAGLERLFSIVFDIAYRSFILNKGRVEPNGIVLIDELDLHLHPSLQQDVLLRLTHTFPNVQFIIATHSPLIVTNLRQDDNNKVFKMLRHGTEYSHIPIGNLFIYDYMHTLEIMDTEPRNFVLTSLSERYIRLKYRKKDADAAVVLNELKTLVGEKDFPIFKINLDKEIE